MIVCEIFITIEWLLIGVFLVGALLAWVVERVIGIFRSKDEEE